jgi:hypothetical protein
VHPLQKANSETIMSRNSTDVPSAKRVQFPRRRLGRFCSGLNLFPLLGEVREVIQ